MSDSCDSAVDSIGFQRWEEAYRGAAIDQMDRR
jgi:hypothetical protein